MSAGADRPRYLGRKHGYVNFSALAADQLEAVRPEEQEAQTRAAHVAWARTQQRRWGEAAKAISSVLDDFASGGVDRRLASDLRTIQRGTERVARRLDDDLRRAGNTS